jgi:hypothetical protein
LIRRHK